MQLNEFTFRIPRICLFFFLAYQFPSCKVSCKPFIFAIAVYTVLAAFS